MAVSTDHSQHVPRFDYSIVALLCWLALPTVPCHALDGGTPERCGGPPAVPFEAVLINGGGRPAINYQSHLLHLKEFNDLMRRPGVPASNVTTFNADGSDPGADLAVREIQAEEDFWLLRGTRLERHLRTQVKYENSAIEGVVLQPATPAALRAWFEDAATRLRPGDTVLLYVTDHGTKNEDDVSNNYITLWGEKVSLSVTELQKMIALLDPGVRIVVLMSQCYSGAFANLMYTGAVDGVPRGNVCGYFSSTADRPAYGCYPENRDKDNVGHSFRFIDALRSTPTFPEAQDRVLVTDRTPDVPLKTSDVYLENVLGSAARQRGQSRNELVDELLREAWRDRGRWEPLIRLLDRIGQAFGYFSPRSLSELEQQATLLPDISDKFKSYNKAWRAALRSLARENLERFLAANPDWEDRMSEDALASLDDRERRELTSALLTDLAAYTRGDTATSERLRLLKKKSEAAQAARYRMQVRLGVVLRMEAVLTSIAAQVYLEQYATPTERDAYHSLIACEAFALSDTATSPSMLAVSEPFPSYEEELKLAETILPGWMGVRFRQASAMRRKQYRLQDGAVSVLTVYPDSPAKKAGIEVGDIVLGPPEAPFTERERIREWVMTASIGEPHPLLVQRGDEPRQITLTPKPYPLKWPELPGPPKVGSTAPALPKVETYRGTVLPEVVRGGPYLLFFWATWCTPCKAALPEVVAFERERDTKVIAITDELPKQLDAFFAKYDGPFPETVAWDEFRRSFLAYGVSGTPGFVLVDSNGKVRKTWTGYRADRGLEIAGWSWAGRERRRDQGSGSRADRALNPKP